MEFTLSLNTWFVTSCKSIKLDNDNVLEEGRVAVLNVLNVNMSVDPVLGGGTAERTVQLCCQLVKSGCSCTLLALDLGLSDDFKKSIREKGVDGVYLPCFSKRFYIPFPFFNAVARVVKNADIVHLMGHWTFINALVFLFCLFYRKPYVVCPAGALPVYGRSKVIKNIYNFVFGRKILQKASAWIAITEDEVKQFIPYGVPAKNITVIPNGINPDDFKAKDDTAFRAKHDLNGTLFILFMGRLNEIKGPDLLLDAFLSLEARYPGSELVFVGPDGGMLSALKERSSVSGKNNVRYLGYLGGDEKSKAYHAADFLVIPSRQEAMSIVVLEAGAVATPVLITDQCGFNEVQCVGGGKVVPASVKEIARGIELMIEGGELKEMGQRLNDYVLTNYRWSAVARSYISLYNALLAHSGAKP